MCVFFRVPSRIVGSSCAVLGMVALLCAACPMPTTRSWGLGGEGIDNATCVAVDADGNVLLAGELRGPVDLGGGPIGEPQQRSFFLAKYVASGAHIFSQAFLSESSEGSITWIGSDTAGNILVAGSFGQTMDFGGGQLTSAGAADAFLYSCDAGGQHRWSRRMGGGGDDLLAGGAVDPAGGVVITGSFRGSADFGGGALSSASSQPDIFLARYDVEGQHVFSKRFGATYWDAGEAVGVDAWGHIFLAGFIQQTVSVGGVPLVSDTNSDIFVAKYDLAGVHIWSAAHGGKATAHVSALSVDTWGDVVLTGRFASDVADFGGGELPYVSNLDGFVAKYDGGSGAHVFSRSFGSNGDDLGLDVDCDAQGNVAITGRMGGPADLGGGPLPHEAGDDLFVARFAANGGFLCSQGFAGEAQEVGLSIVHTPSGAILVSGEFTGPVDFGQGVLTPVRYRDAFLLWLGEFPTPAPLAPDSGSLGLAVSPNPSNPRTSIRFELAKAQQVQVAVFDARGALVRTIATGILSQGAHSFPWDGLDAQGKPASSGVYFVRVDGGGVKGAQKLSLVR